MSKFRDQISGGTKKVDPTVLFNAENKAKLFDFIVRNDLNIKQVIEVEDENLDDKINQINTEFLVASTFFIANESEIQNAMVTETNSRMIEAAVAAGILLFTERIQERHDELADLRSRLFTGDPKDRDRIEV